MVPHAAWPGCNQLPWGTSQAARTGSAGWPQCARAWGCGLLVPVHRQPYVCTCVRCPRPLGACSPVCAHDVFCVFRVRCPGTPDTCSPLCPLGALCCVCGVLGHLAPVHWCARSVRCVACAVSCATWLLFTSVLARCVVLRVRCPGPLGLCSPVCTLGVFCCVCGVPGHLAPVHWCARLVRCVACAVSWAILLLYAGVFARCVVLRERCPGPFGSSSPVSTLGVLCCVCRLFRPQKPPQKLDAAVWRGREI